MGTKKEKTKQVAIRLPLSLYEYVSKRAARLHGGDFTAAIIELLSWARELLNERERAGEIAPRKEMIGEWMTRQNKMTKEQAEDVLRRQKTDGNKKRFGELAVEAGFITQATLDDYLDERGKRI